MFNILRCIIQFRRNFYCCINVVILLIRSALYIYSKLGLDHSLYMIVSTNSRTVGLYAMVYQWGGNWWPKNGILKCLNCLVFMFFFLQLIWTHTNIIWWNFTKKNIGFSFNKPWCTVGVAIGGQKMGF